MISYWRRIKVVNVKKRSYFFGPVGCCVLNVNSVNQDYMLLLINWVTTTISCQRTKIVNAKERHYLALWDAGYCMSILFLRFYLEKYPYSAKLDFWGIRQLKNAEVANVYNFIILRDAVYY